MQLARVAVTLACHSSSFAFKHDSPLDNVKAQQFPGPWSIMETRLGLPQVYYRQTCTEHRGWGADGRLRSGAIVPQGPLPSHLREVGTGLCVLGSR